MFADNRAPRRTDGGKAGDIFVAVGDVAGHPDDVFGASAALGEDGERIAQHLRELLGQIIADDALLRVPADYARSIDHPSARGDTIGVTLGSRPARWQQRAVYGHAVCPLR